MAEFSIPSYVSAPFVVPEGEQAGGSIEFGGENYTTNIFESHETYSTFPKSMIVEWEGIYEFHVDAEGGFTGEGATIVVRSSPKVDGRESYADALAENPWPTTEEAEMFGESVTLNINEIDGAFELLVVTEAENGDEVLLRVISEEGFDQMRPVVEQVLASVSKEDREL